MFDTFISYARSELEFVADLATRLRGKGLRVWVDIEGLYPGEKFWPEISKAIDSSATVVFVISPASIASPFCVRELQQAIDGGKRIVPVLRCEIDGSAAPPALAELQWVFFRDQDDPEAAVQSLLAAMQADWIRLREQARLMERAREWQSRHRDDSLLLRGRDLRQARSWLAAGGDTRQGITELHMSYIDASRAASMKRLLRLTGGTAAALLGICIAAWIGFEQRVANLSNVAVTDLEKGDTDQAVRELEGAHAICRWLGAVLPRCTDSAMNLGSAYTAANRHGDARTQFSWVIEQTVGQKKQSGLDLRMRAYQQRAYVRIMLAEQELDDARRLEGYDQAESDHRNAATIAIHLPPDPERRFVAITRARLHLGRAQYQEALQALESLGQEPANATVALLLSLVHHCLGDGDRSVSYMQQYLVLLRDRRQELTLSKPYYDGIRQRCTRG